MIMTGTILNAEMNGFFSGVDIDLYDLEEKQNYKGQIVSGLPGLSDLMDARKALQKGMNGVTAQDVEALAANVAMPQVMQPTPLRVRRVKTNKAGFTTLICSLD